jgi:molybdopterin-guanine dinucleotide biosynthesis protein A
MRSAVILAGGNGLRLGAEKSLLEFEGKSLICWTLKILSQAADEVIIVARDRRHAESLERTIFESNENAGSELSKAVFTWDSIPGFGPVAGLEAGMRRARGRLAFATGCDLPFLKPEVIERLFELADELSDDSVAYEAAVPVQPNGFFEPLHSVYDREKMQSACIRALEKGERRIHVPLQELCVNHISIDQLRPLDPDLLSFFNLNTKSDLETARALWPDHRQKGSPSTSTQ